MNRPTIDELQARYARMLVGPRVGEAKRAVIRRLRETTGIDDLSRRFGLTVPEVRRICRGVRRERGLAVETDRGEWWPSVQRAADAIGRARNAICEALRGDRRCGGRRWRYSEHKTRDEFDAARTERAA